MTTQPPRIRLVDGKWLALTDSFEPESHVVDGVNIVTHRGYDASNTWTATLESNGHAIALYMPTREAALEHARQQLHRNRRLAS